MSDLELRRVKEELSAVKMMLEMLTYEIHRQSDFSVSEFARRLNGAADAAEAADPTRRLGADRHDLRTVRSTAELLLQMIEPGASPPRLRVIEGGAQTPPDHSDDKR